MKRVILLAIAAIACASPVLAADYPVKYVNRRQFPQLCDFQGHDTTHWTSCVNTRTKTIYVDINADPRMQAKVISAESTALDNGIHGFSGDGTVCFCAPALAPSRSQT